MTDFNNLFFRYPPADACQKLKDVLNVVDFFDDEPDIDEADELREILTHYHMKTLLQVFIFGILFGTILETIFGTIPGTIFGIILGQFRERNFDALSHKDLASGMYYF